MLIVKCPNCGTKKLFDGTIEDHINTRVRCSKKAGGCGERYYSKKNIIKDVGQNGTKLNFNIIPEKVVNYAKEISFESDDIRYFLKKIKGQTFRGNDMDAYEELLFYLHKYRPIFRSNWLKRKRS